MKVDKGGEGGGLGRVTPFNTFTALWRAGCENCRARLHVPTGAPRVDEIDSLYAAQHDEL
jgi:hypothetical protein